MDSPDELHLFFVTLKKEVIDLQQRFEVAERARGAAESRAALEAEKQKHDSRAAIDEAKADGLGLEAAGLLFVSIGVAVATIGSVIGS